MPDEIKLGFHRKIISLVGMPNLVDVQLCLASCRPRLSGTDSTWWPSARAAASSNVCACGRRKRLTQRLGLAQHITALTGVTHLALLDCSVGRAALAALAQALTQMAALRKLELDNVGHGGAFELAPLLQQHSGLAHLRWNEVDVDIGVAKVQPVIAMLAALPRLPRSAAACIASQC